MALDNLDTFAEVIKLQESSGDYNAIGPVTRYGRALGAYGIVEDNWANWAKQADLEGADWHDPKAQDAVAKNKMAEYYNKYNSWDLVAIAWFAGPGNADIVMRNTDLEPLLLSEDAENLPSIMSLQDVLGKSVKDYVDDVMGNLNKELESKGLPKAERYTAKPKSKQAPMIDQPDVPMQDETYAVNIINALSQNTAAGQRKAIAVPQDFQVQVPGEAGSYEAAQIKTGIRREESN